MLYSLHNLLFQSDFIKDIKEFFKDKKKLIIFDVGCYKGVFTKKGSEVNITELPISILDNSLFLYLILFLKR